jgi:5'(3')-deoxyribonucleotidase
MSKPVVLLDMDGVLVHNNQHFLDRLNEAFSTSYKSEEIVDFHYSMLSKEQRTYMYNLWNQPWIYDNKELGQHEMAALETLRSMCRVVACTAPLEGHIKGKYAWLRKYFDKNDIIITHSKDMVKGDILVDDAIHNLDSFPGIPVCYTQPWNIDWIGNRVESFNQIPTVVQEIL